MEKRDAGLYRLRTRFQATAAVAIAMQLPLSAKDVPATKGRASGELFWRMTSINSNFLPVSSGLRLGSTSQRWGADLINVTITGTFAAPGFGLSAVAFSETPVFDGALGGAFDITLTGNVTSSSTVNLSAGFKYIFIIKQDVTGGRTFVWPSGTSGAMIINSGSQKTNVQEFVWDGTNLFAVSAGVSM